MYKHDNADFLALSKDVPLYAMRPCLAFRKHSKVDIVFMYTRTGIGHMHPRGLAWVKPSGPHTGL